MRNYNSLEEIAFDLKKVDLKRQIAKEELILKYNNIGYKLANGFITNTLFKAGITLITRFIAKRIL